MPEISTRLLRLGLGITFLWIGYLIYQNPLSWGNYLQPWAANLLGAHLYLEMMLTAFLDMGIGLLLIFNLFTWVASLGATLQLISILIVSGITEITIRDVGLLGASLALFTQSLPPFYQKHIKFTK